MPWENNRKREVRRKKWEVRREAESGMSKSINAPKF